MKLGSVTSLENGKFSKSSGWLDSSYDKASEIIPKLYSGVRDSSGVCWKLSKTSVSGEYADSCTSSSSHLSTCDQPRHGHVFFFHMDEHVGSICNDIVINTFYRSLLRHWHYDNDRRPCFPVFLVECFFCEIRIKSVYIVSLVFFLGTTLHGVSEAGFFLQNCRWNS